MIEEVNWKPTVKTPQHPDLMRNFNYAKDTIQRNKDVLKSIQVVFDGATKDVTGNFEDPTCLSFFWKNKGVRTGSVVPFNQPRENFNKWLDNFIGAIRDSFPKPLVNPRNLNPDDLF